MCISEIAVLAGSDGRTVPLNEPGTVTVYRRTRGTWEADRTLPFSLDESGGLAGLRRTMGELVAFLAGCRAFVAASASGAAFFELEKARCPVFEIEGTPDTFLDSVWREAKDEAEPAVQPPAGAGIPAPAETAPGKFEVSIKEIQEKHPGVSSKQVLQQFIRRGEYAELAVTCDHFPPWIEVEADRLGLLLTTEYLGPHEVLVVLKNPKEGACC
jgi:Fe-only nitrogenase accessory protein AnfO